MVLFAISVLPLREDSSPSEFWTIMFMLFHVLINSEYLASDPSSSTHMNENFLYWFLNVVTRHFSILRVECLLLDGNPKGYEVSEHIATKVEVNTQIISTLKNKKSIWSMNPGGNSETSMVGPLGILFVLVKRKIGKVSSKSGSFFVDPPLVLLLPFIYPGNRYMTKGLMNNMREICFW